MNIRSLKKRSDTAKMDRILVFYDIPLLIQMTSDRSMDMLALLVQNGKYFVCEHNDETIKRYLDGRVDLRFVYKNTPRNRLYWTEFNDSGTNTLKLEKITEKHVIDEEFYPDIGFFSRNHTEASNIETGSTTQRIHIDGAWEAHDFSRYYAKMADLYATYHTLSSPNVAANKNLLNGISDNNDLSNGGSYGSFYKDTREAVFVKSPLEITGIQYNSPGHIDMRGKEDVFKKIFSVSKKVEKLKTIEQKNKTLRKMLVKQGVLSLNKYTPFENESSKQSCLKLAIDIGNDLEIDNINELLNIYNERPEIFCKIILSIYRRFDIIARFYEEGRVTPP